MKKTEKGKKNQTNLEDTLEFLSLDDEVIEAYNKKRRAFRPKRKSSARNMEDDTEDYGDEDYEDEDVENYEEDDGEEAEYYGDGDDEEAEYYGDTDDEDEEDEDEDYEEEDYEDEDVEYYGDTDDEEDEDYEDEDDEDYEDEDDEEDEEVEDYEDEDDEDEDIEDYEDEEDYEGEDEAYEGNAFGRFIHFMTQLSPLDYVVGVFGLFILAAAIVVGNIYLSARATDKKVEAFAEVGTEIEGIGVIGESGLIAVSDAESARLAHMMDAGDEPDGQTGQTWQTPEEKTNTDVIEVGINITSIKADIKIKFVNKKTNKLIGSVPFEVEVSGGSKTYNLKDEDKDGIIYQTGVGAGTYTVKVAALQGDAYSKYLLPSEGQTVKVADTIEYKKVDVEDEIKTEAEVNVAVEDTAQQITEIESVLTDTVEWVESKKTEQNPDSNYQEINISDIPDPANIARAAGFMKFARADDNVPADVTVRTTSTENTTDEPGGDGTEGTDPGTGGDGNSGTGEGGSSEGGDNAGTGGNAGGGDDTGNGDNPGGSAGGDSQGGNGGQKPEEPPKEKVLVSITVPGSIEKGKTGSASGTTDPADGTITWTSSNTGVVTVDSNGTLTGIAAGTATITGSCGGVSKTAEVTVTEAAITYTDLKIDGASTIQVGKTGTVTGTTTPAGGKVTWTSSNAGIVKVDRVDDSTGTLTGVAAGKATVTGTCEGVSKTFEVTVTEADIVYTALKIEGDSTIQAGKTGKVTGTTTPAGGKVTWTSSNTNVVTVDGEGKLTGVAVGEATITGTCGNNVTATWKVKVVKDVSGDTTSKLKDKNGAQIYVKDASGRYVEAVYADYYRNVKFYLKKADAVYTYTGWQTIDGFTYFFDKNGNYVTGNQVIQGAKYSFDSSGRLASGSGVLGIDVSKWNGTIDWNAVRNSGVSYAIIRCGYRGSTTGVLIEDPKFRANIQGAQNAGIKVGVYFFTQAVNDVEAVEEASMVLSLIRGYNLAFPVFLDVEATSGNSGRADNISADSRTAVCSAFCQTIQNSGYKAGIYANKTWFDSFINTPSLTNYKIWLAQYSAAPSYTRTRIDMWQYSSKGMVSGINGNVDMNISYMNY